jgi:hypothetical protein
MLASRAGVGKHGFAETGTALQWGAMQYLLLVVEPVGQRQARGEAEGLLAYQQMLDYAAALQAEGVLQAAQSLQSLEHASRVSQHQGQWVQQDGPFAEAKEMVGGFFLVDAKDHAHALALARRCPAAGWATVEVRALGPCFSDGLPAVALGAQPAARCA